ncbi:MAG TPA: helix-turn-helix domain-containing protein [Streptosporangiaceae bacterium]|nr:helix-turn-helix domain-containing protein [Streptosporangiaceae bacterium]
MVRLIMAEPPEPGPRQPESARDRLLAAATAVAMRGGIADLSLRELAAAIGTSHRMLLYHFGSREGLLAAVTLAVEEAERATLREVGAISADDARRFWARYSDQALWPQEQLFFELYVHALRGRAGTEGFLEHVVTGWIEPLTAAIADSGTDPQTAQAAARLSMAVTRGLLLDLLATHDTEAVTEAFELFLQLGAAATSPPARPSRASDPAAATAAASTSAPPGPLAS